MRASVKNKREADKAAEWLAKFGNFDTTVIEAAKEKTKKTKDEVSQEAEGVLSYLANPKRFVEKTCKRCDAPFLTNYAYNAYCEDACRMKSLRELGIEWDPYADPTQRWGGSPPLTIQSDAIQNLIRQGQRLSEWVKTNPTPESQSQTGSLPSGRTQPDSLTPEEQYAEWQKRAVAEGLTSESESPHQQTSEAHTSLDFSLPELDEL